MSELNIPITKAGKGVTFAVDSDEFNAACDSNPNLLAQVIAAGLQAILNTRMSKLEAPSKLEGAALESAKAAALAKASENLKDLYAGKLTKKSAASKSSESREVITEATRLAKEVVKNEIRKAGLKISHVAPKEITEHAKELVAADPSYVEMAKENIAKRSAVPVEGDIKSLIAGIKPDAKLVAKAEKAKADRKTQLSAKQAGLTAKAPPRKQQSHATH